jgi:hypothetical protein
MQDTTIRFAFSEVRRWKPLQIERYKNRRIHILPAFAFEPSGPRPDWGDVGGLL